MHFLVPHFSMRSIEFKHRENFYLVRLALVPGLTGVKVPGRELQGFLAAEVKLQFATGTSSGRLKIP
jgi:hypothetical protein